MAAARSPSAAAPFARSKKVRLMGWKQQQQQQHKGGRSIVSMATESNNSVASTSDERTRINGVPDRDWWQEACVNFELQGAAEPTNLLQLLHEGARIFQMAMDRNASLFTSWFVNKWTGFDDKAWAKLISYQVSVFALLQATNEIACRGEGRDRDVHVFVQRSLAHQCDPLEKSIRKLLSSRGPLAAEWEQLTYVVATFVNILEKDPEFEAVTSITAVHPDKKSDVALLKLAISSCAAAMKLGPATLSCPEFSSTLGEEIGRLMNMLSDFLFIGEVYAYACALGLKREFFLHFGPRGVNGLALSPEERSFWVDNIEQHIRSGLVREGVLSNLRPYDTAEALERDFAVFGFFAAFGRQARAYLMKDRESQLDEPVASLLRYLEGGAVLIYPQLSTLTYYQLFMEVVCEEMEWLPAIPKPPTGENDDQKLSDYIRVSTALNTCSRWVVDFLKYSTWVQHPSGVRVVDFLLKCQSRLIDCREASNVKDLGGEFSESMEDVHRASRALAVAEMQQQLKLFDEDLENMEEALCKLETLLEAGNKDEKLAAVRKDLEKIRRLKTEAEALKACVKAEGCPAFAASPVSDRDEKAYTDVFNKSIEKLKEASSDLWRGTQLLGNDVATATVLLRSGALGRKLTEREKKMLRRTFTDLASVIPIGFLMLLPVTAVGHAAILAAIQKYVPALIPSAYAPERLDLLRGLEKVKQMEKESCNPQD